MIDPPAHPEVPTPSRRDGRRPRATGPGRGAPPSAGPLVDLSSDLLAVAGPDGRLLEANVAFHRLLGREPERLVGLPWWDLLRPEDRSRGREAEAAARERGDVQTFRGLCPTTEGLVKWFVWRLQAVASGHLLLSAQDITLRTTSEHRMAESEGLFQHLAEHVREVFWVTEPGPDPFRYVSPSYDRVFGRRREDLYAAPHAWYESVHPDDRARVRAASERNEAAGSYDEVYRIVRPDGEIRWIRDRAFPVKDASGRLVRIFGLAEDVTALRDAEDALRESEHRLMQAQKMEALGRLAAGVSHDFNNLLTVILGYAQIHLHRKADDDTVRRDFETILRAGEKGADLTRQLLAFSRSQVLRPRVLDLREVVRHMQPIVRRLLEADIEISEWADADLANVRADSGQMGQVLLNLVANARDAMPLGGTLWVELRNADVGEADAAQHPDVPAGRYVVLSVRDSGIGMDDATIERIFEPFFTTKEGGHGTGLGLSTVHGIVTQSGGCLEVDSAPGRGSTFRVYLPRVDESAPAVRPPAPPRGIDGHETVVVAEDDDAVRTLIAQVLGARGYQVLTFASGRKALEELQRRSLPVALLLSDVVLPEMGGRELLQKIRETQPNVRALFISGYTDVEMVRRGSLARDVAFLSKPFTVEALLRSVRAALDARA
jgi:PAS domain S-box-containing protein